MQSETDTMDEIRSLAQEWKCRPGVRAVLITDTNGNQLYQSGSTPFGFSAYIASICMTAGKLVDSKYSVSVEDENQIIQITKRQEFVFSIFKDKGSKNH